MKLTGNILAPILLFGLIALNASYWLTKKTPLTLQTVNYQWSCFNVASGTDFNTITVTATQYTLAQYLFDTVCNVDSNNGDSVGNSHQPSLNIRIRWLPIDKIIAQGNRFHSDFIIAETNQKPFLNSLKNTIQWVAASAEKPLYLLQKDQPSSILADSVVGVVQEQWISSKQSLTAYLGDQNLTLSDIQLSLFENDKQLRQAWALHQIDAMITHNVSENSMRNDLPMMGKSRHWIGSYHSKLPPNTECPALLALSHYFSQQSESASLCVDSN